MTKDEIQQKLIAGECIVEFTKINGEVRKMPCTLKEGIVPPKASTSEKKANTDVLNVWCTDKKEWRSFRVANVISVSNA